MLNMGVHDIHLIFSYLHMARIIEVTLGRKAIEKRVVSQDLELWLSNVSITYFCNCYL